jgi:hypothetical protein
MDGPWGTWDCPYEGCDERNVNDPDPIRVTCCGNGHVVLLGPCPAGGWRWAEKYEMTQADFFVGKIRALREQEKA